MKLFLMIIMMMISLINGNITIPLKIKKNSRDLNSSSIFYEKKNRVDLLLIDNYIYFGEIGLGTPVQKFIVAFDSGSAYLWVPNLNWPIEPLKPRYDSSKSSTHVRNDDPEPVEIWYYDNSGITGFQSIDDLTIGDAIVQKQEFIEATEEISDNPKFVDLPFVGLLGLAFEEVSFKKSVPIWSNMKDQGLIQREVFSMYLKYHNGPVIEDEDEDGGALIFGAYDEANFRGEHTYVPLTDDYFWQFEMGEIVIGDRQTGYCLDGCPVMIDSGVPRVIGQPRIIRRINRALWADKVGTLECDKVPLLPTVSFTIGGRLFSLTPKDYLEIKGTDEWRTCNTLFQAKMDDDEDSHDDNMWVLGNLFMRRFHTVFDFGNKKIGFAEAVHED